MLIGLVSVLTVEVGMRGIEGLGLKVCFSLIDIVLCCVVVVR